MLALLGRWTAKHRMWVLAGWSVITLAGAMLGGAVYDRTQSVDSLRPDAESMVAQARIDRLDPQGERIVAVIAGRDFNATALVDSATQVMFDIRAIPGVASVTDAYTAGSSQVAADDQSSLVVVELRPQLSGDEALAVADQVAAALRRIDAPRVLVGGELLAERTFGEQAVKDAAIGESIALVVLCGVLTVVLGGLIVGSLPLAGALAAVAATLLALSGLAEAMPVSEYAVNVVTLLGLGLAVDYSLLILARFREEREAAPKASVAELLAATTATAGRAVLVSGLTVGAALAGLFVFAEPLLAAMALGGALVVGMATVIGLTLVPALIALAHRRIPPPRGARTRSSAGSSRRPAPGRLGLLARLAAFSQRRPAAVALTVTAGLLLLASPLFQITLANSDARSLPAASEERLAYEAVERDFATWAAQPVTVLIEAGATEPPVPALLQQLRDLTGEKELDLRSDLPADVTVVDLRPAGPASGEPAQRLVRDLRALDMPVPLLVGGPAAELIDARESTAARLPIAVAVIVVATGLLLVALTGSVVVPIKAICMNILTLLATLGVLVAVFQWGWGSALLGFEPWGALDITTPLLLFVFIFGLSMDYEVFLLARIKEEWDRRTANGRIDNDRAVLAGITATGPVVTTAAVALGIVFLGFALGELIAVKEIGVGMTVAVLLDVTVVRGLLLPSVMSLLGAANWWRPGRRATPAL
ncbi:MMPL family transporter [Micromonospora sp. WMMC250]|uniref:MMPL family transporter n=1 Tax=Micromonospora sp. WMMC250 TaxID=3014781 RepID=UPI0022B70743|nr:MMPL family transporter [Micromonospora sp. WMMC250]MCZ7373340.1 MMPL family transporter [Micromonospora sp. WMMC250]